MCAHSPSCNGCAKPALMSPQPGETTIEIQYRPNTPLWCGKEDGLLCMRSRSCKEGAEPSFISPQPGETIVEILMPTKHILYHVCRCRSAMPLWMR